MNIATEIEYCREREQAERAAADAAADRAAHDAHFRLAERYADKVWSLSEQADELARIADGPR